MTTPVAGGPAGCPGCGRPNRDGARFCAGCGESLAPRCAACGAELDADARFCDTCGAPVGAATSASAPSGARKVVTVMFADLAGSTALAERMDPESVHTVMQRYYALLRDAVEARNGRIVKYTGDGAMAVFGVPETREDDTLNALHAALAMHDTFAPLAADVARERNATIGLRVGVNTGEVVVGADDDDVVGDAVNLAARLERAAPTGGVLVGESTWRLARGAASFGRELVLHVAGKSEAVRAWPLVAIERETVELRTDLVGRTREVDLLRSLFADAVATASPRLVTIVGSPGVGKTRLASELDRVVDDATVLVARCSQQTGAPLAPIAEMLHAAVDGSAADPGATIERLGAQFGADGDRDRVLRTIAAVLGTGAGATPEESFWALRRLLEQRTRTAPVVLVVDDLQWGEAILIDLVEHLAEWTRGALLLVVTARPELREIRGALTDGARHTVIALEGLDGDATGALACELLGTSSLPGELLDRLPGSTGGNPLFLRELLRMLVDDGVLRAGADGGWVLGVAPHAIDVPPTIQSLLAARLDRLTPDEQLVLERAAVWGAEFPLGALVELLPAATAARAQAVVEQLRRKELLESVGSYWIDEPVYRFHHVLIRDAAYRRILRDVRASLHEQLAAWVDEKTASLASEYDELVGHHLEESYRQRCELGPPNDHAVAIGRSAGARLGAAAQRALDRDDPSGASLASRALQCLPADDAMRADLLLIRCDALLTAADAVAAREAVRELEKTAATPRLRAWAACFAAQLATIIDPAHLRETEQRAATVAAELTELGDARGAAKAHAVHAAALARLGRFAEVEDALDRALTRAREADDRRLATVALAAAPVAAVWGPSPVPRAGGRCLDVVRLLRITAGSPVVEATSLRCQAVLESFRGRTDAARRLVATARDSLLELGLVHGLLEAELFAGIVELGAGELAAADAALRRAYDGLRGLGADADAARAGALLARVALERGALADAERLAHEAEHLAGDDLQAGISWRRVVAEVLARRGEHDEARTLAETAVAIAAQTDALVHHADACMALAAVRRAAGDEAGATQAAREAADLYERKGATALVDIARAAFDRPAGERSAQPSMDRPETRTDEPANSSTRAYARWCQLFAARDWHAIRDVVAPDFLFDDRRTMLKQHVEGHIVGRNLPHIAELYGERFLARALATRGDRLALLTSHTEPSAGVSGEFNSESLLVVETSEHLRLQAVVVFAVDDLGAAIAELEARYIDGEGAPFAEMLELIAESNRAFNARDWDGLRATYAPSIDYVDRSTAGWASSTGGNDMSLLAAENATEMSDVFATVQAIHSCTAHAAVATVLVAGYLADRGTIERSTHIVYHRDGAWLDHVELFDQDDLENALDAYRRLATTTSEPTNRCAEVFHRWCQLFAARAFDEMASVVAETFAFDDRRPLTGAQDGTFVGRQMRLMAEEIDTWAVSMVAVRGERLALITMRGEASTSGPETFAAAMLAVIAVDGAGRFASLTAFPPEDLDAAVEELDRRYMEGEGAPYAEMLELVVRGTRACNDRDWEELRLVYTPEIASVNAGFAAGWGTSDGREALFGAMAEMFEVFEDARATVRQVVECSADAIVCETAVSAAGADGGTTEALFHIVYHRSGSAIDRMEIYDEHHGDAALETYRRLTRATREPANRATEVLHRWAELFATRQWDAMRNLVVDDFVLDDRRPIVGAVEHGRDAGLNMQLIAAHGADRLDIRVLAVRGSRLALVAAHGDSDEPGGELFAAETLSVVEIGDDDRLRSFTGFAPGDVLAAYDELELRFIAGEGAPYADLLNSGMRQSTAVNARDWARARLEYAPEVTVVDHYTAGWSELHNADDVLGGLRSVFDMMPGAVNVTPEIHALCADAMVCSALLTAPGDDGERVELVFENLMHLGPRGIDRIESWPADRLDEALAAFHALESRSDRLSNRCTSSKYELCRAVERRDWDTVRHLYSAPRHDGEDRRRGIRSTGNDPVENYQATAGLGLAEMLYTPIVVRGESLALGEELYRGRGDGAVEVRLLVVNEVHSDGRFAYNAAYDGDDLDAALADLEQRYLDGEGAPCAPVIRALSGIHAAYNERDWDAVRACCAPDVALVDHRPASWGAMDLDGIVDTLAHLFVPDARMTLRQIHDATPDALLGEVVTSGHDADGALVESSSLVLVQLTSDGIARMETFAVDALDAARHRYGELAPVVQPSYAVENRCTTSKHQLCRAVEERDWEDLAALYALDYEGHEYRHGLASFETDPVEEYRASADLGLVEMRYTPLAIRGQSFALGEEVYRGAGDGTLEVRLIVVNEVDPDGRFLYNASFDVDDLEAALADLDDRYLTGEGEHVASTWSRAVAGHRAQNARDWDGFAAGFTSDLVAVDHYYGGLLDHRGRDAYVEAVVSLSDPFPETLSFPVEILAISDRAVAYVARVVERAQLADALPFITVLHATPAGIDRIEVFPDGERAAPLVAYERLMSRHQLANACTRAGDRLCELFARRDWEALGALFAPGFDGDDFRHGFTSFDADPVKSFGTVVELAGGPVEMELRPVAVRGDRLALSECWMVSEDEFALEPGLFLTEVDDDGRFVWMASYDLDAHDRAFADLDRRYMAGEAAPYRELVEAVGNSMRAVNERDWKTLRRLFAPDIVDVDHYAAGWGSRSGVDGAIAAIQELLAAFPNARSYMTVVPALTQDALVATTIVASQNADGARAEMEFHVVFHRDERGRIDRMEVFPAHDLAGAFSTFRAQPEAGVAGLAQTRAVAAVNDMTAALDRGDHLALDALHAPGSVNDDRRSGVRLETRGTSFALGDAIRTVTSFTSMLLATRGDGLCLHGSTYRGRRSDGFEFETAILMVHEVDSDGRIVAAIAFDADDYDAAYDELDQRFVDQLQTTDAEAAALWTAVYRWVDIFNRRAWAEEAALTGDYRLTDHRPASFGTMDATDQESLGRAMVELSPGVRNRVVEVAALGIHAVLLRTRASDESTGDVFESPMFSVLEVRGRLVGTSDLFALEDEPVARARFAELVTPSSDQVPTNRAYELFHEAVEALVRGDRAAFADAHSLQLRSEDRRALMAHVYGRDELINDFTRRPDEFDLNMLAARGDDLELHHARYRGTGSGAEWEFELLCVAQLGSDGRIAETVNLDADDIDAAYTELDERFVELRQATDPEAAAVWRTVCAWNDGFNRRERAAVEPIIADDMTYEDHRVAGYGALDRAGVLALSDAIVDVTPGARIRFVEIAVLRSHGVVARTYIEADAEVAGGFGSSTWWLLGVRDAQICRLETFAVEGRDAAVQRLDELAP